MNSQLFPVLVLLCTATHIIRFIYEVLKHKKILRPNNLSFVIILFNMILLWTSWFMLCSLDESVILIPAIIRYLGISLVLLGIIFFLVALFTIKTLETFEGSLITNGIYFKIRHPMYLGFLLWLFGLPIFYGAVYSFILAIPFAINVLYWRYLEELELDKRYLDYRFYKKKTVF